MRDWRAEIYGRVTDARVICEASELALWVGCGSEAYERTSSSLARRCDFRGLEALKYGHLLCIIVLVVVVVQKSAGEYPLLGLLSGVVFEQNIRLRKRQADN